MFFRPNMTFNRTNDGVYGNGFQGKNAILLSFEQWRAGRKRYYRVRDMIIGPKGGDTSQYILQVTVVNL